MKEDNKRRLVGALGGGGGALVLGTIHYLIWPQQWIWEMALSLEIIGLFLIIMAVYVDLKK